MNRTKNATRNIVYGLILKIYQIICPFIVRSVMIYTLGVEYIGINSLFASILQVLNISELGVGVAMVYSMYRPIAEDDEISICALLKLYKKYYKIIGGIIAVIGVALFPFIPYLISGDVPDNLNIYILYILNLTSTVLSYWMFAYRKSILDAHQRMDINSKVTFIVNTIQYVFQLIILLFFKDYYLYLVTMILAQIFINIVTAYKSKKMYPRLEPKGDLSQDKVKEINQRVRDLFTAKIGGVIQNSVDAIIISSFLGLKILGRYNNYYYILSSLYAILCIFLGSITAAIGNSIITETVEKNYKDLNKITFIMSWLSGVCSICLLCLYQPFMIMWVGRENTLPLGIVICLSIYLFVIIINQVLCTYKDSAGIWHKDRMRPLITAFVNLSLNLLSVKVLGLYGVVLSTVLSMLFVGMPWIISNLFTTVFKFGAKEYIYKLFKYVITTVICAFITYNITSFIILEGIFGFLVKILVCFSIINIFYLCIYIKTDEFKATIELINKISRGRIKFIYRILEYI